MLIVDHASFAYDSTNVDDLFFIITAKEESIVKLCYFMHYKRHVYEQTVMIFFQSLISDVRWLTSLLSSKQNSNRLRQHFYRLKFIY